VTELTTGWEADLPVADSLLRQFVHSYADRTAGMAAAVGGRTHRDADAAFADLGSPFLFDNAVVLLRPPSPERLAAILDRALEFYPPARAFVVLSVFPVSGEAFASRGLAHMGHPPFMALPSNVTGNGVPEGLVIQRVRTKEDLAAFRQVLVDGFGLPDGGSSAMDLPAVLIAGDEGQPVYEKMGFLRLMRITMYFRGTE
jgi:hypothetical protein